MMSAQSSSESLSPRVTAELERLLSLVSNVTAAKRMWQDLMTKEDREKLQDKLDAEPANPAIDSVEHPGGPTESEEVREGCPGRLLHRSYCRWGAVGLWMIAKKVAQPRAIVELAYEHGFITEPAHRRLLQNIGEGKRKTRRSKLPVWDRDERTLRFENTTVRTIRSLNVARNVVAILDAFQDHHWHPKVDAPAGLTGQALHDAIYRLNRGLTKLRFHVDGDGTQIRWSRHR
jgi:hypothetical protein